MKIGIDDVVLSMRDYLLNAKYPAKSGGGVVETTLAAAYPDIDILPRGLDFNEDDTGPRVGIRYIGGTTEDEYFGNVVSYDWNVILEVDALRKDTAGNVDPGLSLRTSYGISTALDSLFQAGGSIPCSIYGKAGAVRPCGSMTVSFDPRRQQIDDTVFAVSVNLEKVEYEN